MEYFLHVIRFTVDVATRAGVLDCLLVRCSSQTPGLGAVFLPVPASFPPGFLFLLQLELSWETCKLKNKRRKYLSRSEYMPHMCRCHCEPEEGVRPPAAGVIGYWELPHMDAEDWMQASRENRRCSLLLYHLSCIFWRH